MCFVIGSSKDIKYDIIRFHLKKIQYNALVCFTTKSIFNTSSIIQSKLRFAQQNNTFAYVKFQNNQK